MSVGKLYLEVRVRQCFKNNTLELYYIILRQKNPSSSIYDTVVDISHFLKIFSEHSVGHFRGAHPILFQHGKYMLNVFSFWSGQSMLLAVAQINEAFI